MRQGNNAIGKLKFIKMKRPRGKKTNTERERKRANGVKVDRVPSHKHWAEKELWFSITLKVYCCGTAVTTARLINTVHKIIIIIWANVLYSIYWDCMRHDAMHACELIFLSYLFLGANEQRPSFNYKHFIRIIHYYNYASYYLPFDLFILKSIRSKWFLYDYHMIKCNKLNKEHRITTRWHYTKSILAFSAYSALNTINDKDESNRRRSLARNLINFPIPITSVNLLIASDLFVLFCFFFSRTN